MPEKWSVLFLGNPAGLGRAAVEAFGARVSIAHSRIEPLQVTASLGISIFPSQTISSVEGLVQTADLALYEAKRAGRNKVSLAPSGG